MDFDHLHAYIELLRKQHREREIFFAHGADIESAEELFRLDYRQLNSDRKFYKHVGLYLGMDDIVQSSSEMLLGIMDEIENPTLYDALSSLKPIELEIVLRHAVNGESLKDIAQEMAKPYDSIKSIYRRAKKKIKIFF